MFNINNLESLKFTKIREYRINFRYKGILYSLNEHSEGYESILRLTNRDTDEIIAEDWDYLIINRYIKVNYNNYNKPIIYKHIDKKYFINMINCFLKV